MPADGGDQNRFVQQFVPSRKLSFPDGGEYEGDLLRCRVDGLNGSQKGLWSL